MWRDGDVTEGRGRALLRFVFRVVLVSDRSSMVPDLYLDTSLCRSPGGKNMRRSGFGS